MRDARASDHWRRIRQRRYLNNILDINFSSVKGIGNGGVNLKGGITAICGANGAGKSTLMSAIKSILLPNSLKNSNEASLKLGESRLTSNIIINGQETSRTVNINQPNESEDMVAVWIDFCTKGFELIRFFSKMDNIEEFYEQFGPREANENELQTLSYLVGKDYRKCTTYELEFDDDDIQPYFVVESGGVTYRSETMGLGEISIHYLLWILSTCPRDSIILIEEPENYLSPRTQRILLNVFAEYSDKKGLRFIISTHSPAILNNLSPDNVILLSRAGESVNIINPDNHFEYLRALGVTAKKFAVILVEDRAAREFTKIWVSRFSPLLYQQLEIIDVGSVSNIETQLKNIPKLGNWITFVGLFDGDEFGKTRQNNLNWEFSFLPGDRAPELLLRELAYNFREQFSVVLGRDISKIHMALSNTEGVDHHDWLEEIHKELGVSYEQIIYSLFEVWMGIPEFEELASRSFQDLHNLLFKS